ncbi:neuronal tyrosine-phosphorylated phosphoinositide-3-kinase adapter 2 [Tachysurus fulvidraco]|uniref:neuronal tyrosine-phosphorylated phosphoinositide-3-kinase adapter 2 n=1 Tax=Tachysurus fulvidraco TaxID=1234273 RepID=UPI001FEDA8F4|nr:neuronal tyrosine-phosphorylated phosphoinositide-3-kinase adapter 2 [Tachysurus fulvidraco]
MPLTMMSSREEEALRFFQYIEDSGLRAYGGIVTRDLVWNEKSRIAPEKNDKKRKQEEVAKRTSEEVAVEGKHLRMGSTTMSEQQQFSVRSQSLNSVGGVEEDEGSPNSRKQPPPKPRRDPNTKLSTSSEAVDHSATTCKGGHSHKWDATQGCSEECRRVPPPKPKRNPNTQLSTSFDESYILNSKDSPPMAPSPISPVSPPQPQSPKQDSESEEPVYIEMSGNTVRDTPSRSEPEEPGEAVYEEMKYPTFDDFDSRWDLMGYRSQCITPCPSDMDIHAAMNYTQTPRSASHCDIPAPFPNLLTHRPPLLVFPPVPAQCSPNSDESPLTPVDVNKLAMLENAAYSKSPSSSSSSMEPLSSASSSHLRRELTATPTITVSGRSSAPPLPCALYRGSSNSAGAQRSHSACPSPVSMGRCLTPLSLMRAPPFEGSFSGAALPRHHSSTQNVAAGRSRTPTSPLDELTNLFTSGRNMLKKSSSGRKSKEPSESEAKGKGHGSESKREHKERSHHNKESKRDKERGGKSSHRRESKDREPGGIEALQRRDSKDRTGSHSEPIVRRDSKDRGSNMEAVPRRNSKDRGSNVELVSMRNSKDKGSNVEVGSRRNSKDKGSNVEPIVRRNSKDKSTNVEPIVRRNSKDKFCSGPELLPKQGSKDRGCSTSESIVRHDSKEWISNNIEPIPRHDSRDRICNGLEHMLRQDSRDLLRNGLERHDSRDRSGYGQDLLIRHSSKDQGRTGPEARRNSKEGRKNSVDILQGNSNIADSGWDSKEWVSNGTDVVSKRDYKDKGIHLTEPHHKSKDKSSYGTESPKAHDWDARSGPPSGLSSRSRRSPVSPTTMMGNSDLKMVPKVAQFLYAPIAPSPLGTPQRRPSETQEMPPFPWLCGDSTMMETIERKQRLCREIRSRQQPAERSQMESMPSCKKANGQKKYGPPPYSTQTTVFWDTAI